MRNRADEAAALLVRASIAESIAAERVHLALSVLSAERDEGRIAQSDLDRIAERAYRAAQDAAHGAVRFDGQ